MSLLPVAGTRTDSRLIRPMSLAPGARRGPYEIVAPLGAGGMGEVYRARDARLGRDVAIKVLPAGLSVTPERLQRFEQEARAVAALNHPNILALYDIGTDAGAPYLVTELLEGLTLRARLAQEGKNGTSGLLPVRKAVEYAVQVVHGLAAAHEKGIVHRDLKPENIFVTDDGRVKILDFGLAKLTQPDASAVGATTMPTTPPNTLEGVVLGTIGYMSPEQVRGVAADHRADIFAFGTILYEMLSGGRAFPGETAMDAMTAIVNGHPPELSAPERHIPPALVRIVDRCLEKSPAARFQSTRDLAFAIEALSMHSGAGAVDQMAVVAPTRTRQERTAWALAAAMTVLALGTVALTATLYLRRAPVDQWLLQFTIPPPQAARTQSIASGAPFDLAMSPDGRRLAFVATDKDGRATLWLRSLDAMAAQALRGTENAGLPFWSPDGRFLAFVADGKLKKIDVMGGPPQIVADKVATGGTWGRDGTILFNVGGNDALSRVSANGGAVSPVTTLEQGELRHVQPHFLPDGQHFLYAVFPGNATVHVGSLNSKGRKPLLSDVGQRVRYSQGHLFYTRAGTLLAQPFDAARLELAGDPRPVAEIQDTGLFDVSTGGILTYHAGVATDRLQLAWLDRTGKSMGTLGDVARYYTIEISPDGAHAVGEIREQGNTLAGDLWQYDLAGGGRTRLTFDAANTLGRAVWSPDGSRIILGKKSAKGNFDLFEKVLTGSGSERPVLEDTTNKLALSWSPDARFLLYNATTPGSSTTGANLWVLPLAGDKRPFPYLPSKAQQGQFSPDSRWVAYESGESGRSQVYVAAFPGAGAKRQVSTNGGTSPRWRRDGKELFWLAPGATLMASMVNGEGSTIEVLSTSTLFAARANGDFPYDVAADGQRFLVISAVEDPGASGIAVVVNWPALLKR